jgi:hypothetical protein
MEETALGNPLAPLDELLVQDRDLPRRTAEADEAELEPEAERFPEARVPRRERRATLGGGGFRHVVAAGPACLIAL